MVILKNRGARDLEVNVNGTNGARKCSVNSCPDSAVTRFAHRELCLQHFLSQSYEDLDRLDATARSSHLNHTGAATLKNFVDECSRCALEVSLQCKHLDNLARARLLDILLWSGELVPQTAGDDGSAGESLWSRGTKRKRLINVESYAARLKNAAG